MERSGLNRQPNRVGDGGSHSTTGLIGLSTSTGIQTSYMILVGTTGNSGAGTAATGSVERRRVMRVRSVLSDADSANVLVGSWIIGSVGRAARFSEVSEHTVGEAVGETVGETVGGTVGEDMRETVGEVAGEVADEVIGEVMSDALWSDDLSGNCEMAEVIFEFVWNNKDAGRNRITKLLIARTTAAVTGTCVDGAVVTVKMQRACM